MDAAFLTLGLLLSERFRYNLCIESHWEESYSLRNYHPDFDSESNIAMGSTLFACMSFCLMTEGCCSISFIANISLCAPRRKMTRYHYQNSSSVWNLLRDDGCTCGWHRFETSCFLFPDVELSWQNSTVYCSRLQAQLTELNTEPKNTFIRSVLTTTTDVKRAWTSGSDSQEEDKWIWMNSGSPITNFTNWCREQPNNMGGKGNIGADCLCFLSWNMFACWNDCSCFRNGQPLCEKPAIY